MVGLGPIRGPKTGLGLRPKTDKSQRADGPELPWHAVTADKICAWTSGRKRCHTLYALNWRVRHILASQCPSRFANVGMSVLIVVVRIVMLSLTIM